MHSMTAPVELAAKPEPDTITLWPFVSPELGETDRLGLAEAAADARKIAPRAASNRTARTIGARMSRLLRRI